MEFACWGLLGRVYRVKIAASGFPGKVCWIRFAGLGFTGSSLQRKYI